MIKVMSDATLPASKMISHMRTHDRPAQPGALADRRIDIRDARDALLDQIDRLSIERGREPVGNVAGTSFLRMTGLRWSDR